MSRFLRIVLCCVPYAFLALYGDVTYDTLLQYLLIIPAVLFLIRTSGASVPRCLLGHALSFVSSLVFMHLCRTERWRWYFKPFSAEFMAAVISLIIIGVQWILVRKKRV